MSQNQPTGMSRREREIMDIIYRQNKASAAEVLSNMPEAPSYSAVRALLAILVKKGLLKIEEEGPRYLYSPTRPRQQAGRSAIRQVIKTFFDGSIEKAVSTLLDGEKISPEEITRLQQLIDKAKEGGAK